MQEANYDLRVFAEGVRIPASGITRIQRDSAPLTFSIKIPPIPQAFRVLPNTLIHVFVGVQDVVTGERSYVLFAEGRLKNRSAQTSREGGRYVSLNCQGFDGDFDEVKLGFDIGQDEGYPRERLKRFFYGQSSSEPGEELPGLGAAKGAVVLSTINRDPSLGQFFGFYHVIRTMIETYGPVVGLINVIANLASVTPLFEQLYNAVKLPRRIAYSQNEKLTPVLAQSRFIEMLTQRIQSMKSDTTLMELMASVLPDTLHHYVHIASPRFDAEKLRESEEEEREESDAESAGSQPSDEKPFRSVVTEQSSITTLVEDPRIQAYLDLIARYEAGNVDSRANQYRVLYGGSFFSSFEDHPRKVFQGPSGPTTAAGRYQITAQTWDDIRGNVITGGLKSFGPYQQDLAAVYLIKHRAKAIGDILKGDIVSANHKCAPTWAGLPKRDGYGHYAAQRGQRRDHSVLIEQYNDSLQGTGAPRVSLASQRLREYTPVQAAMPSLLIKPRLHFAPPPLSNVVFPSRVNELVISDNFQQAPTRVLLFSEPLGAEFVAGSFTTRGASQQFFLAPRQLQMIFNALSGGDPDADLMTEEEREDYLAEVEKAYNVFIEGAPFKVKDDSSRIQKLLMASTVAKMQQSIGQKDIISAIRNSKTEAPGSLLGIYTYEEIFRGMHPMAAFFPFPTGSGEIEAIEAALQEQILKNTDLAAEITDLDELQIRRLQKFIKEEAPKVKQLAAANLYANYLYSLQRRSSRTLTATTKLNLNMTCGFTGAVYDRSSGWVLGEVLQITDSIDVDAKTSTTSFEMGNCLFTGDYDDPSWKQMHIEAEGEAMALDKEGFPENPVFYDDAFSAQNIGENVYQPFLGIGSVIDYAKTRVDGDVTTRSALNTLWDLYREQQDAEAWEARITARPMATEEDVMVSLLGGAPKGEGRVDVYEAPYNALEIPKLSQSFMQERARWAHEYVRSLQESGFALNVTDPV